MPKSYTLHFIGMPHTTASRAYNACAYSAKDYRALKMFGSRGHECLFYGNEGAEVAYGEHIQILTEDERAGYFGSHDRQKLYDLRWDSNEPYWRQFNERAIRELRKRVRPGDFILSLSGNCHQPIAEAFPGCYSGIPSGPMWVEYGIGYFGTFSRYTVYESETHRSWIHGRKDSQLENNDDAAIGNYYDPDDFKIDAILPGDLSGNKAPYFFFIGRVISSKGWDIALQVTKDIGPSAASPKGQRILIAGQGDPGELPPYAKFIGHVNIEQRTRLMHNAVATFTPTRFREPFGGTATETQLTGTPAISSDHGAFVETVEPKWRCASHREFVEAGRAALALTPEERAHIRNRAMSLYSFDAIYPQYLRYFTRLYLRWGSGYYEMRDPDKIYVPSSKPKPTQEQVKEALKAAGASEVLRQLEQSQD